MLYRTIIENDMEKDVVMMYTDSITTTKKLNFDSKKLGDFSCDFEGSIYALQSGFYAKNDKFEKSRGIGQLGDETIIHKETKIDSKGRLVYEFEKIRVGTLKLNIKNKTLGNIGAFTKHKRNLKLNGDRGRLWWGRLTDVRLKEHNISVPFPLPEFPVDKIWNYFLGRILVKLIKFKCYRYGMRREGFDRIRKVSTVDVEKPQITDEVLLVGIHLEKCGEFLNWEFV